MAQVRSETKRDANGDDPHTGQRRTRTFRLATRFPLSIGLCLVFTVLALALNLLYLGKPSIWFDEAFSVELARQPLPLLWHIIFGPEPNMELYYLLLHFWLNVTAWLGFQPVEAVVRFPSAIFAALSTGVVFLLGRRYLGKIGGSVAAGLYACNNLQLIYAQQTRAYALQLFLLTISWLALFVAISREKRQWPWWVLYSVSMVLAIYSHLFSGLVLFAQIVAAGGFYFLPGRWRLAMRRQVLWFIGSLVAIGLLGLPMFIESQQGAKTGWLSIPQEHALLSLFVILGASSKYYLVAVALCVIVGLLAACVMLFSQRVPQLRQRCVRYFRVENENEVAQHYLPFAWAMLCWFILPIVVSFMISQGSLRLFSTRYLVVIVPPLCLLVGLGVAVLRWRIVQVILICILLLVGLRAVPRYYQRAQVETWNTAVHWLQSRYQPNDGLVCYDNQITQGCQIAVQYYLDAYPTGAQFAVDSPGAFSWQNYGPANPQQGYQAALDPVALAAFGRQHARIFYIVGRVPDAAGAAHAKQAEEWLDQHDHFIDQIVTSTVTIRLYATH